MTIAFDAASNSSRVEDPSWTHTPVGTPGGVLVFGLRYANGLALNAATVTYGSLTLTLVSGSESLKTAVEASAVCAWSSVEGDTIPTGVQTVTITDTGDIRGICYTVTSDEEMEVNAVETYFADSETDPSFTLELGGVTSFVAQAFGAGPGDVPGVVSPWANWNETFEFDEGTGGLGSYYYEIIGSSDPTYGVDFGGGADDINLSVVSMNEVSSSEGPEFVPVLPQRIYRKSGRFI